MAHPKRKFTNKCCCLKRTRYVESGAFTAEVQFKFLNGPPSPKCKCLAALNPWPSFSVPLSLLPNGTLKPLTPFSPSPWETGAAVAAVGPRLGECCSTRVVLSSQGSGRRSGLTLNPEAFHVLKSDFRCWCSRWGAGSAYAGDNKPPCRRTFITI